MMEKVVIFLSGVFLLLLAGCGDDGEELTPYSDISSATDETTEQEAAKANEQLKETSEKQIASFKEKSEALDVSSKDDHEKALEEELLESYSKQEIEYARVWKQLGPNQEIDKLYVNHIQEGEPINPHIESSARYPEDVIQLTGSRLVDGSITYSGNGDGTINIYYVPLRWEASTPKDFDEEDMRIYTESIIENTELITIEPFEGEEIHRLVEKINRES